MGVLTSLIETGNPPSMIGAQRINVREQLVESCGRIFESKYNQYDNLEKLFNSDNAADQYRAATTVSAMEATASFLEGMKQHYGEAVVTASLGALTPRILDVVRIFYPNQVAQELVDIQPLGAQVGTIFVMKPRYENTFGGVTAGTSQVFVNRPTYNNYASEQGYQSLGTGNNSAQTFTGVLSTVPVRPGSIRIEASTVVAVDDGAGNLTGTGITSGTIDYLTGAISVTYDVAPANSVDILTTYRYSTEINETAIRALSFDMATIPVSAKLFPLLYSYHVAAGLAAQAHLAVDVQDTLVNLTANYLRTERDERLVQLILANSQADSSLNFDATMSGVGYDKRTRYGEIEVKVDEAESLIQGSLGRGGVDFVLCGNNAANVFRNARGFRPEPIRAPVGPHKIGTLRDGTVSVIKSLSMNTNKYVFGFKGYMTGDSATILAEWIPLYVTPVFQSPTMTNKQGMFSAYDLFVNQPQYYRSGTLSNYTA